ncbi:YiiG family protein [Desulfosarcina sp. OttesenSCG-928-A07]|nr:YiiG family protein [Desulfosarcina sp. OttesenSCG-928-G17]MDL2328710.1 YiiG family protein [Desulfosarcina sp. OttesenSCG-928-A07]
MRMKILFCTFLVVCLLFSACGSGEEEKAAAQAEKAVNTTRWNAYVALTNASDGFIQRISSYFQAVGKDVKPVVENEKIAFFLRNTKPGMDAMKSIAEEAAGFVIQEAEKPPQSELDIQALAFAQNLQSVWADFCQLYSYYESKSHTKDGLAKGRQLHTRMLADFKALTQAHEALSLTMAEQSMKNMQHNTQAMRDKGMTVTPAALEFVIAASAARTELTRQELSDDAVDKLDGAAFQSFCDELEKTLAKLETAGANQTQVGKENLSAEHVDAMIFAARQVKASAAGIMALSAKGEPEKKPDPILADPTDEAPHTPTGYNHLVALCIQSYNNLVKMRKTQKE